MKRDLLRTVVPALISPIEPSSANRFFGNQPGLLERTLIVRAGMTLDITSLNILILEVIKLGLSIKWPKVTE